MPRKKTPPLTAIQRLARLAGAQIEGNATIPPVSEAPPDGEAEDMENLQQRVKKILGIADKVKKTPNRMLFFVMYDIENDKVRRLVAKYLEQKGCTRIQKSIFLADQSMEVYNAIKTDLAEVQAAYDNHDSIIVLPVSTDYLKMMKIIGQKIDVDIITHSRNTLFF